MAAAIATADERAAEFLVELERSDQHGAIAAAADERAAIAGAALARHELVLELAADRGAEPLARHHHVSTWRRRGLALATAVDAGAAMVTVPPSVS